jgi:hypothetical protein
VSEEEIRVDISRLSDLFDATRKIHCYALTWFREINKHHGCVMPRLSSKHADCTHAPVAACTCNASARFFSLPCAQGHVSPETVAHTCDAHVQETRGV